MAYPNSRGQGFRPVLGEESREAVGRFLLAQGWAGLHLGDTLRRLPGSEPPAETQLLALFGPVGEVRGAAMLQRRRLQMVVPLAEDRSFSDELLRLQMGSLERVSGLEGQLPAELSERFPHHPREITVAAVLRLPERALPTVRRARPGDAEALHRIYDHVSWMRLDSPVQWSQRLADEPSWVAEGEGRLLAVARWTRAFGGCVEIGGVATDPESRRRGAATAVVLAATAAALSAGLVPVLCFGDPALAALYLPLGFEVVGREMVVNLPAITDGASGAPSAW
ncbi:MAG: GNAT family N-acetyltransferase [Candidatus Dormibacteria bacterium]